MESQVILSGIKPSGAIHIGNYLGAIMPWVKMQHGHKLFLAVADLHAITVPQAPVKLHNNILATTRLLLACGIDPKKTVLFIQSHVAAHAELAWILNTITPVGELERMTQFKEKREQAGALAGLLNYPVLQAADILLYQPNAVPVGNDQLQHLELTRTLARKFNNRFGKTFKIPKAVTLKNAGRIMGLGDPKKKMSKSSPNPDSYIALLDPPDAIKRKIKFAVTDSGKNISYNPETKPAIANLMTIYSILAQCAYGEIEKRYYNKGYAKFKQDLAELIAKKLEKIQEEYEKCDEEKTVKILQAGANAASKVANNTLFMVKQKLGFVI